MKKGMKVNFIAWVAATAIVAAAVPINMIFTKLDVSVDVTPYNAYSLSDNAKEALSSLEKPVEMTVLYELDALYEGCKHGEAEYMMADMFVSTMRQMDEFDKITLNEINIEKNPGYINEIDPDGFMNLSAADIILECDGNIRDISFLTLFTTNPETGSVEFYGENAILGAIDYLQTGITPTIYFAEGHGEKSIDKYANLVNMLKTQNYAVKPLNIGFTGSIPEDATTIVFAAPAEDISDKEKEIILDYTQNGGNLTMLLSPQEKKIAFKNIEEILKTYEIAMDYNRIYETQSGYCLPGDQYTVMCQFSDKEFNKPLIEAQGGSSLYMPSSRSFYYVGSDDSELEVEELISTYDTAMSELYGGTKTDAQMPAGILYLAAKAEDPTRNGSKLFVAGSADFIEDATIKRILESAEDVSLAPYLFLSTVSWMDKVNTASLYPTRVQATDYITIPDTKTGNIILVVMIAFPILIAGSGVIVWARRHNA